MARRPYYEGPKPRCFVPQLLISQHLPTKYPHTTLPVPYVSFHNKEIFEGAVRLE